MKHCPTCNRTYEDDSLNFCLKDGMRLVSDQPASFDPLATVVSSPSKPLTEEKPSVNEPTPEQAVPSQPLPFPESPSPFAPPPPNISPFAETSASIPLDPLPPKEPFKAPDPVITPTPFVPPQPIPSEPMPTIQANPTALPSQPVAPPVWQQPQPMPATKAVKKGWFGRNWKWVVPIGCFGMIGAFVAAIGLIMYLALGMIKSDEVYKQALDKAKSDEEVVSFIGQPISDGFMPKGSINTTTNGGSADLQIPISGPKGSGTIFVEAQKANGEWEFKSLLVAVEGKDGDKTINLLEE
jgi:hypothetical protein